MGPIVLGAIIALVVLVLALAGSKLARQTLMLIAGLIAAALLALWVLLAVGMTSREVRSGLAVRTDHHFRRQAHLIWLLLASGSG